MTATAIPQTRKYTLEEYCALPEGPPYFEYENGDLIEMHSPTIQHQDITALLYVLVRARAHENRIGRGFTNVDVFLPDGRVFIPDFGIAASDQVSPVDGKIHGAPLLVAEITSSNEARDRAHKFRVYYDNGIEWYWLISQSLIVEEYRHTPEGYLRVSSIAPGEVFRPQLLPGLEINLTELLGASQEAEASAESSEQAG